MSKAELTEDMLRIYEGIKKEQRLEFIIEDLIHAKEEKPYKSEVDGDGIKEAQRQEELNI